MIASWRPTRVEHATDRIRRVPHRGSPSFTHGGENGTDLHATNASGRAGAAHHCKTGRQHVRHIQPRWPTMPYIQQGWPPEIYIDAGRNNADLLTPFNFGVSPGPSRWAPDGRLIAFQW